MIKQNENDIKTNYISNYLMRWKRDKIAKTYSNNPLAFSFCFMTGIYLAPLASKLGSYYLQLFMLILGFLHDFIVIWLTWDWTRRPVQVEPKLRAIFKFMRHQIRLTAMPI